MHTLHACMHTRMHTPAHTHTHARTRTHTHTPGADPGFSEGGSESGVDIEGGVNPSIVSLKQGSGGHSPPEAMGYLILDSTKIPKNARL